MTLKLFDTQGMPVEHVTLDLDEPPMAIAWNGRIFTKAFASATNFYEFQNVLFLPPVESPQ